MLTKPPAETVLDASAVLALVRAEPGADSVARVLPRALLTAVNLTEVIAVLRRNGMTAEAVDEVLARLQLPVLPFDESHARATAEIITTTRHAGLSLGDCACLALGRLRGAPVMTAERGWNVPKLGIDIRVIR